MKWTYELDNLNRFKYLKAATEEDKNIVEIEKADFRKVICGFHGLQDGKIVKIGFTDEEKLQQYEHSLLHKIDELKEKLQKSDYKMMKCYEAFISKEEMPYNFEELKAEREAWRSEINKYEKK